MRSPTPLALLLLLGCGPGTPSQPPSPTAGGVAAVPADPTEPIAAEAADPGARGQCTEATEQSFFDCATDDGRWLSVCASKPNPPNWVQFRAGPPMAATVHLPAEPSPLAALRWESSADVSSTLRALHLGDQASLVTVLRPEGDPEVYALLPGDQRITCRARDTEDSLPDLAPSLTAAAPPRAASGKLEGLQNGDVACYVQLLSPLGPRTHYGEFELCETAASLIGKHVALSFTPGQVIAPSCQGDPECADSIEVQRVSGIAATR